MLNNYLKSLYKSKIVPVETIRRDLPSWSINKNTLNKKFTFHTFKEAMDFVTLSNNYINSNNIKAEVSNVYNNVNIIIREIYLNELTELEYKAAIHFEKISQDNLIDNLVENNYCTTELFFNSDSDMNNLLPTDIYEKQRFLIESDKLKLI